MLGRRCKLVEFKSQVSNYFWGIVTDSEAYSSEVLDQCVVKFAEMLEYWSIELKKTFFAQLADFMKTSQSPTLPVLKLF